MQYYESKKDDAKYQKDMEPIKALDLLLAETELKLRDETDKRSSLFITGLKNQLPDTIRKHIENPAGHRGETLSLRDKERLSELTAQVEQEVHVISAENREKLRQIEEKLGESIPHRHCQRGITGKNGLRDLPADPVLKEQRETRELARELREINEKLTDLHTQEITQLSEETILELVAECPGYTTNREKCHKDSELTSHIHNVTEWLSKLERLNIQEIQELNAEQVRANEKSAENDNDVLAMNESITRTLCQCKEEQRKAEEALNSVENLESRLESALNAVRHSELLEREIENQVFLYEEIAQPNVEEIDREIELKVQNILTAEPFNLSSLNDITPEGFPKLYHIYESTLQEFLEESHKTI